MVNTALAPDASRRVNLFQSIELPIMKTNTCDIRAPTYSHLQLKGLPGWNLAGLRVDSAWAREGQRIMLLRRWCGFSRQVSEQQATNIAGVIRGERSIYNSLTGRQHFPRFGVVGIENHDLKRTCSRANTEGHSFRNGEIAVEKHVARQVFRIGTNTARTSS
ncbi:hypothetical protein ABH944_006204 [Caballeronia udeis]|uniref:Uncharacterized protein n=1 Tax=Caballeronia udeis TaxID=1232866 RepID=A0ABW8MQZ5_9BURK